ILLPHPLVLFCFHLITRFLLLFFHSSFFFLSTLLPPYSPLFPYTTLFRSPSSTCYTSSGLSSSRRPCEGRRPTRQTLPPASAHRSEEHTSELQSLTNLVCRLLLEKKNQDRYR